MSGVPELGKGVPKESRAAGARKGGSGLFGARRSKSGETKETGARRSGSDVPSGATRKRSGVFSRSKGELRVDTAQSSAALDQAEEDHLSGAYVIAVKDIAIGKKLGQGATADVYAGEFRGEPVAVKLMRSQTQEEKAALANELAIHCKFSHDNCLRMIGYFATRTSVGIVMEKCVGTLHEISLGRRMSLREVVHTALGIARGMEHLHEKKVSHRDLKSANVLVDAAGVPKVADFGLSKADTASYMKSLVGTVSHMAPELLEHRPYKKSADVYAFAMVVWQMLSGELPYKDYTAPLQVVYDVVGLGLRPDIPADTPRELADIVEKCWSAEPNDRPEFSKIVPLLEQIAARV